MMYVYNVCQLRVLINKTKNVILLVIFHFVINILIYFILIVQQWSNLKKNILIYDLLKSTKIYENPITIALTSLSTPGTNIFVSLSTKVLSNQHKSGIAS